MTKRLLLLFALILTMAVAAPAQTSKSDKTINAETLKVVDILNQITAQTGSILSSGNITPAVFDKFKATIRDFSKYSTSKVILRESDLTALVNAFYDFSLYGDIPLTKDDIRSDFSRFSTLGQVVAYLSGSMMSGLSGGE